MPQHRDLHHSLHARPCSKRTRCGNLGGFRRDLHSRVVFLLHDPTFREQIDETRKHHDASAPTTTPAVAALFIQADATHGGQRSRDLVQVASSTYSQLRT